MTDTELRRLAENNRARGYSHVSLRTDVVLGLLDRCETLQAMAEASVADALVRARLIASKTVWVNHVTGEQCERDSPLPLSEVCVANAVATAFRMLAFATLEDRIKALEVERDEIAAVHAELRALFPERPIVNMIDAVREALDRPAISVADARTYWAAIDTPLQEWGEAEKRIQEALRAHAAKGGE